MDFRKWILALSVLALMVVPSAQAAFSCAASAGVTPTLRAEGIAELVGDLQLNCSNTVGDTSTAVITPNIQLIFSAIVTSKIVNTSTSATEALMLLDDPGVPPALGGSGAAFVAGNNLFQGSLISTNSLQWLGVPIQMTGGANSTRLIRFTNLRVNANSLGVSSTLIPQAVTVFISVTGTTNMSLTTAQATLGFVQTGLNGGAVLRNAADTAAAGKTFQQCVSNNKDIAGDNTKTGNGDFLIKFTEGFGSSFKTVGGAAANYLGFTPANVGTSAGLPVVADFKTGTGAVAVGTSGQAVPGVQYFTESGLILPTFTQATGAFAISGASAIGQATQGTRLYATFSNIPAGVQIFVTSAAISPSTSGVTAVYVGADQTAGGSGVNPSTTPPGAVTGVYGGTVVPLVPVTLTGGTGTAVWEITSASSNVVDTAAFGVVVAYVSNTASNLPGLTVTGTGTTPAQVAGGFAPTSAVTVASSTAPIPRFAPAATPSSLFNIAACVTNLLFPFVTNQAGFDTGIALVNTSLDNAGSKLPFNTTTQHGTCTVYYFGAMAGGGALPAAQTTTDIAAGSSVAFNLNGGGVPGSTSSAQGFQGYIIARCNFQYAHGYAFISNLGVAAGNPANFAQGYIALVIPDRTRVADPFSTAGSGSGEQLAY